MRWQTLEHDVLGFYHFTFIFNLAHFHQQHHQPGQAVILWSPFRFPHVLLREFIPLSSLEFFQQGSSARVWFPRVRFLVFVSVSSSSRGCFPRFGLCHGLANVGLTHCVLARTSGPNLLRWAACWHGVFEPSCSARARRLI